VEKGKPVVSNAKDSKTSTPVKKAVVTKNIAPKPVAKPKVVAAKKTVAKKVEKKPAAKPTSSTKTTKASAVQATNGNSQKTKIKTSKASGMSSEPIVLGDTPEPEAAPNTTSPDNTNQ
jgi:hypothetical protein